MRRASFLFTLFLSFAAHAEDPLNGTWKIQNISCSSGATVTDTEQTIVDSIIVTMADGKGSMSMTSKTCEMTATCDYQFDGTTLSSTHSALTFDRGCGFILNGRTKYLADSSATASISGNLITVNSIAGANSACPRGDTETDTLSRQ